MTRQLRKFENIRLLCISNNKDLNYNISTEFKKCKELIIISDIDSVKLDNIQYDVILVNYDFKEAHSIILSLKLSKPQLPMIILSSKYKDSDILRCLEFGAYSLMSMPINFVDLKLSMAIALNQSKRIDKIEINNGIYYDIYRERFYDNDSAISLTNYEFQVLKLLLDNHTKIISYDIINDRIWKEKDMSIFTMRNVINKIRKKTYYEIIRNDSKSGYQIDTLKIYK